MNQFELLVTFTFNNQKNDRLDHIKVKARMSNWLKNQQKRAGKFEYLIVAEFHKKHEALHFHSLIKGYVGDIRESRSSVTGRLLRQKGKQVFELPSFKSGFTNVKKIDNNPTSHSKVATYLGKYITKDMPYFANKQRYWISKCLQTPETIDNPPDSLFIGELLWEHKNDFGILEYFERPHLNEALKYA